jgi:hypothetical protein
VFLLRSDDVLAGEMAIGFELVPASLPGATRSALDSSFAPPSAALNPHSAGLGKVSCSQCLSVVCIIYDSVTDDALLPGADALLAQIVEARHSSLLRVVCLKYD